MSNVDINVDRRTDGRTDRRTENRTPISHPATSRCVKNEEVFIFTCISEFPTKTSFDFSLEGPWHGTKFNPGPPDHGYTLHLKTV